MSADRPRVLVVDDQAEIRTFLTLCLRLAGYPVWEAGNRADALRYCRGPEPIALLVCDVKLPGDRGRDVAEALTALQPGMQTLFVSGLPHEDAVDDGLVPAGCPYLQKPFPVSGLQAAVRELLHGGLVANP